MRYPTLHHMRRWLSLGLKLAFTVAALALALHGIDFHALPGLLQRQQHWALVVAAGLLVAQIALGGERWRIVLKALIRDHPAPRPAAAQAVYYASVFYNCCLPGTLGGDVARLWLARTMHLPFAHIVASVILDRAVTLLGLFVLAAFALPMIDHPLAHEAWKAALAILAAGLLCACLPGYIERALQRWEHNSLIHRLRWLLQECHALIRRWRLMLLAVLYAVTAHVCYALSAYTIAHSLGIGVGVGTMLGLIPLVMLATALPISIGGWGVREASVVGLLGLLGVEHDASLMLSVELGLLTTLVSLPGGLLWLVRRGKKDGGAS